MTITEVLQLSLSTPTPRRSFVVDEQEHGSTLGTVWTAQCGLCGTRFGRPLRIPTRDAVRESVLAHIVMHCDAASDDDRQHSEALWDQMLTC